MKKPKKKFTKKQMIIALVLAVLVLGASGYLFAKNRNSNSTNSSDTTVNEINYDPPTKEEKAEAEQNKDDIIKQTEQVPQTNVSGKKQVTVVITNARTSDQDIVVNAYVQGIFEDGGTCTATFTKGSSKVTKTSEAFADASTTNCAPFIVQRSEFASSGDWQLVLSYSSAAATGTSQPKTVTLN